MAAAQQIGNETDHARLTRKRAQARAKKALLVKRARRSAAAFIEYALRNEGDGSRIQNADFHLEWQETLEEYPRVVLMAPVEHAKTQQVAVGKVLHLLGVNPNLRLALISNTAQQAEKILKQIRAEIERNPRVREVFPDLKPSSRDEDPWHQTQITVERSTISKDPSVQACGWGGPIVGSRLDGAVLDDVLDFENTRTEIQRKKVVEWFDTTLVTRIVEGGFIWLIGTPWHPDDLLHDLGKRPGYVTRRYSAVHNPDDPPKRWRPLWPAQWSVARLVDRMENTPIGVFARKYLVRVRLDSTSRFKQLWLDRMCALGKGRAFTPEAPRQHHRGPPLLCFTGVDLGVGKKVQNASTSIFTLALTREGRRLITDIESGQWQAPEIIDRLASVYRRYDSVIFVENNGAQQFLLDMCEGKVPVFAFTTGSNKWDEKFGVESLAVEMRNGLWIMPSGTDGQQVPEEGRVFMNQCLYFDPEQHTGDRLMAGWLARECARKYATGHFGFQDTLVR